MSVVEYIKCDGGCGRVTSDKPEELGWGVACDWARFFYMSEEYHLCHDCAEKVIKAVGME